MREESVARRYAAALFAQAHHAGTLDAVREDLNTVAIAVQGIRPLQALLSQPTVTGARKKAVLHDAFKGKIGVATQGLLDLLVDKRRIALLGEVNDELQRLVREYSNIALATATTAVPLTLTETTHLQQSLEARTGKKIELKTDVDPALLGGVLVRIGDTVFDGSVRGNLDRLREQLLTHL